MTMQRRHFTLIAEVIKNADEPNALQAYWAAQFASALASTNPNFNRARFLRACGVEA